MASYLTFSPLLWPAHSLSHLPVGLPTFWTVTISFLPIRRWAASFRIWKTVLSCNLSCFSLKQPLWCCSLAKLAREWIFGRSQVTVALLVLVKRIIKRFIWIVEAIKSGCLYLWVFYEINFIPIQISLVGDLAEDQPDKLRQITRKRQRESTPYSFFLIVKKIRLVRYNGDTLHLRTLRTNSSGIRIHAIFIES